MTDKPHEPQDGRGTPRQPIVLTVHGHLDLGSRCVCCGKKCSSTIMIDLEPDDPGVAALMAALNPLIVLVDLVYRLADRKRGDRYVGVPFCERCRLRYYLPEPGTGWLLTVFCASIVLTVWSAFQDDLVWMMVGIALMFGSTIWFGLGNRGHGLKRLPIVIVEDGEWHFYFFHGGYGYEWARNYPVEAS